MSGTVIASLSSTVLPPLGITILGMAGALSAAFVNEIQSEETERPITRGDKRSKYHKK